MSATQKDLSDSREPHIPRTNYGLGDKLDSLNPDEKRIVGLCRAFPDLPKGILEVVDHGWGEVSIIMKADEIAMVEARKDYKVSKR